MRYKSIIDQRAAATRAKMRQELPRDIASGTMRLALHLSTLEADYLERANPDTLGLPDTVQRDIEWRKFIEHPDSKPFRVREA